MKKQFSIPHSFIFIFIIIALVLLSIAVIAPTHRSQDPPPPTEKVDISLEVGSTDGITVLAFIISGVIILPLITSGALKRKKNSPQK